MRRLRDVAKAVGLDDVAELQVDDQAAGEAVGFKLQPGDRQAAVV
jgi:hypothetical protein